jgi:cytochrome c oxidase subunit 3
MSEATISVAQAPDAWKLPYRGKVAMACLIIAESAIFTIFVVA